ncbi:hypothetical protein SAMN05421879_10125 [Ornithinimicrobium cerasi]|uniref:Uncharacterized protein n=2 Tax=Ornithinimicrobium cerasi TaxID=2248773 RepID=A0A285VF04_9MICO|nr:hypothetical protein SAMN05421879_10125 [Ornithinimicrobium cerasi]
MADALALDSAVRFKQSHREPKDFHPGDDIGDVLVWLCENGYMHVAVDLVVDLVKHLRNELDEAVPVAVVIKSLASAGGLLDKGRAENLLPALQREASERAEAEGFLDF